MDRWLLAARAMTGKLGFLDERQTRSGRAEVYLPGAGWKGLDATSGRVVGNHHLAVAVSRHPEWVLPVSGSFLAATHQSPVMRVSGRGRRSPGVAPARCPTLTGLSRRERRF